MRGNNDRLIIVVMQGHDGTMQLQVREEKMPQCHQRLVFLSLNINKRSKSGQTGI